MSWTTYFLLSIVIITCLTTCISSSSGQSNQISTPIYQIEMPDGYRDWRMISVADVGAPVNDLRVKLGNDVAIQAFREGTIPFPEGTIIARLAYQQVTSEDNNKAFRAAAEKQGVPADKLEKLLAASFVAGSPTNVQFIIAEHFLDAQHSKMVFVESVMDKYDSPIDLIIGGHALADSDYGVPGPQAETNAQIQLPARTDTVVLA